MSVLLSLGGIVIICLIALFALGALIGLAGSLRGGLRALAASGARQRAIAPPQPAVVDVVEVRPTRPPLRRARGLEAPVAVMPTMA